MLVAKSDIDIIMTIFVPIDGGDFIVPVSLGVYAATAGCGATLEETFEDLKASVSLNAATTYNEIETVVDAKADKSN